MISTPIFDELAAGSDLDLPAESDQTADQTPRTADEPTPDDEPDQTAEADEPDDTAEATEPDE